jgi:hypothetical protein
MGSSRGAVVADQQVSERYGGLSQVWRHVLGGFVFFLVFASLSYLINMVAFAEAHAVVTFFRAEDHALVSPVALSLTTLIWSFLISLSYTIFGRALPVKAAWLRGLVYGALVFFLFVWQQEMFYFQFIDFPVGILWGALLHMALAFPLGCMFISVIQTGRWS